MTPTYVFLIHSEEEPQPNSAFTEQKTARAYLERCGFVEGLVYHEEDENWSYYASAEGEIAWSIRRVFLYG